MNAQLQQRTPEWHAARVGRITGSRIAAVLGHSPWQSRKALLAEMVREALGENIRRDSPAMAWGRDHEDAALADFEMTVADLDDEIIPGGWYTLPDDAYLGYSPDAHVPGKYLVEIKCPFNRVLPDDVPAHYADQVQLGMHVMDLPECALHFWTPAESKTFFVRRDPAWWDAAQPQVSAFLADFRAAVLTPAQYLTNERRDPEWLDAACQYVYRKSVADEAAAALDEAKKKLESLAYYAPAEGGGVRLEYVERAGSVDWKRLAKTLEITQETQDAYRGKSTTYARISVAANDE
jgi:putative phage-type endonuclease